MEVTLNKAFKYEQRTRKATTNQKGQKEKMELWMKAKTTY